MGPASERRRILPQAPTRQRAAPSTRAGLWRGVEVDDPNPNPNPDPNPDPSHAAVRGVEVDDLRPLRQATWLGLGLGCQGQD